MKLITCVHVHIHIYIYIYIIYIYMYTVFTHTHRARVCKRAESEREIGGRIRRPTKIIMIIVLIVLIVIIVIIIVIVILVIIIILVIVIIVIIIIIVVIIANRIRYHSTQVTATYRSVTSYRELHVTRQRYMTETRRVLEPLPSTWRSLCENCEKKNDYRNIFHTIWLNSNFQGLERYTTTSYAISCRIVSYRIIGRSDMNIYIYIYMFTYDYIFTHTCMNLSLYIHIHIYIYIHTWNTCVHVK